MPDTTNDTDQWGMYAPRGLDKFLFLTRKIGLAHGPVKNIIARAWLARHPDTPADITYQGARFRLHPGDNVTDAKMLFGSRGRDRIELEVLRKYVEDGGVFVDIGANIGYYSLMAAVFGASRIIAIEPNPPAYARLEFNIAANGFQNRIVTLPLALGEHSGQATLFVPEQGDIGGSRISDHTIDGKQVHVRLEPLATVLAGQDITRIDALKIDVEGMEDIVLFPFFENTSHHLWPELIIIEHTSVQDWKRDILSWLLNNGYRKTTQSRSNMMLVLDKKESDSRKGES